MSRKRIVAFVEGEHPAHFWPLAESRPLFMLRCGAELLYEKWIKRLQPTETWFFCREVAAEVTASRMSALVNTVPEVKEADLWIIDPRWLPESPESFLAGAWPETCGFRSGERLVALRMAVHEQFTGPVGEWLQRGAPDGFPETSVETVEVAGTHLNYLWDIVDENPDQIARDFTVARDAGKHRRADTLQFGGTALLNDSDILIGDGVELSSMSVLDARNGPIILDDGVRIEPFSHIEGPAVIGAGSIIYGAQIRGGTTIGPVCRVGGEVEASVFLGYGNKHHEGFFGHGVIGEWVNLGALTTNSDLKNNYGTIRVSLPSGDVDTGRIKVGSFLADHTKTGIGTLLPTGGVVGFASNVFGGDGVLPKFIPEFSWGGGGGFVEHQLDKALATAGTVAARRGVKMDAAHQQLFRAIFTQSSARRSTFLGR